MRPWKAETDKGLTNRRAYGLPVRNAVYVKRGTGFGLVQNPA
jgi:hypothetical protein